MSHWVNDRIVDNAIDTVANMSGKSLLLDQLARINAKPELEILADDVSCSHGVTVGSLDPEQLFYLCSRGIPNKEAKKMLISAFSEVVFENLDSALKEIIKKLVLDYHGEYIMMDFPILHYYLCLIQKQQHLPNYYIWYQ